MPAVVLVSAKGSPGVTTAAAALAAASMPDALLVELDPSGGSVQALTGEPAATGLVDVASRLRRHTRLPSVERETVLLPAGLRTVLAPLAGPTAETVIASVGDRWLPALALAAPHVVVDGGRWEPSQRTAHRVVGADLVTVVCRPTVAGVETTRHVVERLRAQARRPVAAVVVGDQPYPPEQAAAHLDLPLAGTIGWDPRGASALWAEGASRRWLRSLLARSAASTLAGLGALADSAAPAAAATGPAPGPPDGSVR